MSEYLFILCPPYSGSTVLWKLVATSPHVTSLPDEGQFLEELKPIMRNNPWENAEDWPWEQISEIWHNYWDENQPIKVEKSPPNLMRPHILLEHFNPASFILMVRNPYAHCEGLMRRNGWDTTRAAEFSMKCLSKQTENAQTLENATQFTYEQLVDDPQPIAEAIQKLLPQIGKLDVQAKFTAHSIDGRVERGLVNLNEKKIAQLSNREVDQLNQVFVKHQAAMDFWGYRIVESSATHAWEHFRAKAAKRLQKTFPIKQIRKFEKRRENKSDPLQ